MLELSQECFQLLLEARPYEDAPRLLTAAELASPAAFQRILRCVTDSAAAAQSSTFDLSDTRGLVRNIVGTQQRLFDVKELDGEHLLWFVRDNADYLAAGALVAIGVVIQEAWTVMRPGALGLLIGAAALIGQARQIIFDGVSQKGGIRGKVVKSRHQPTILAAAAAARRLKAARDLEQCQPLAREILTKAQGRKSKDWLREELANAIELAHSKDPTHPDQKGTDFLNNVFNSLGGPWGAARKSPAIQK